MDDNTKRYGIITGGTGSFGSIQWTENKVGGAGTTRKEIMDVSRNMANIANLTIDGTGSIGGDLSVTGNLTVNGTTTSVNSTAIDLGDRIVNLNSSNASGDAGFYVNDTTTNQTGSLLWDSSADAWMGGLKDAEVHLVDLSATQTLTNKTMTSADLNSPDIDGGTIDGATIATSDVTVGASKTLDVSAGTLTTSAAQNLAIVQGAGANVDVGTFDLRAQTLTADGLTATRVVFAGTDGVLSSDADMVFAGDTLTVTKLGAFEAAGAIDFSDEAMTNVNVDSGAIDGATIGAASAGAGTFTTLTATTSVLGTLGGNVDHSNYNSTNVDIDSGAIDGTVIGANSAAAGTFAALAGTTLAASTSLALATGATVTGIDNGSLGTSATLLATQGAIKTYVDAQVTAQDLDFAGDSGGALSIDLDSESLTIAGSTGLKTVGSSNTLTVSLDFNSMGSSVTTVNDADIIAVYDADAMSYKKITRRNFIESSALDAINIDGGSIDGTVIGAASAAAATVTTLGMSSHLTFSSGATIKTGGNSVNLGESANKFAAVYATNVYTGDMHLKNERGDWTIFEESDHLRIRNNTTGQTFKMGMTPIEE